MAVGAWGPGPFDNDSALDWCNELDGIDPSERHSFVERTLRAVADESGYVDADDGQWVIAAVAIVALQLPQGKSMTLVNPPDQTAGVALQVTEDLRRLAVQALDRVTGNDSEVVQLWREGQVDSVFDASLRQIRNVLSA